MKVFKTLFFTIFAFSLVSCATSSNSLLEAGSKNLTENQKLDQFFEKTFQFWVDRSPQTQTYMGYKTNYGQLDVRSEDRDLQDLEFTVQHLRQLKQFDYSALDKSHQLSYQLFEQNILDELASFKFRHHRYPVNQMFGVQSGLPSFMINMHRIENLSDAKAYISRLNQFSRAFEAVISDLKIKESKGVIAPYFVYPKALRDAKNIISGQPFNDSEKNSPLLEDFKNKIEKLKISKTQKAQLLSNAKDALLDSVKPGYQNLISYLEGLEKKSSKTVGAWALPDGESFYRHRLKTITTTNKTPEEIHELGLKEVARIHGEMRKIVKKTGHKKTLKQFFKYMQTDPKFFYPENEQGKKLYLKDTKKLIGSIESRIGEMFNIQPKAKLQVKPVEAYREKSAGLAFYQGPPLVGDRPGIYYVNLYDMKAVSKYEMEALAYHEAVPGHHMQISIAKELEKMPKFRKFNRVTAYSEGWGLYAEYLPKEFGFYSDPYSDFGRLSMELWRACRLVVDTGLHFKKWTREQSIKYLNENTPSLEADNIKAVERYIVMPGQATAYKIGMIKILEMREWAKSQLKDRFDIRNFHDVTLANGALPLNVLEQQVQNWVKQEKLVQ